MQKNRLLALVVGTALMLGTSTAVVQAAGPEPTYPTGSFKLERTSQYIQNNGWDPETASVGLTRLSVSDDVTPATDVVVRLYSGSDIASSTNGRVLPPETATTSLRWGGGFDWEDIPAYTLAGTYHPFVTLTDGDGHTTRIDLPTVTLLDDRTPPVVTLRLPKEGHRKAITSWHRITGTTVDAGIDNPATNRDVYPSARVLVLQKRRGYWYEYRCYTPDPRNERDWCKRKKTLTASLARRQLGLVTKPVGRTGWRTEYIRGLTKDPLVIVYTGADSNANFAKVKTSKIYHLNRKK